MIHAVEFDFLQRHFLIQFQPGKGMVLCQKSIPSTSAAARSSHTLVLCPQEILLCPPEWQGGTLKTHRHLRPTTLLIRPLSPSNFLLGKFSSLQKHLVITNPGYSQGWDCTRAREKAKW